MAFAERCEERGSEIDKSGRDEAVKPSVAVFQTLVMNKWGRGCWTWEEIFRTYPSGAWMITSPNKLNCLRNFGILYSSGVSSYDKSLWQPGKGNRFDLEIKSDSPPGSSEDSKRVKGPKTSRFCQSVTELFQILCNHIRRQGNLPCGLNVWKMKRNVEKDSKDTKISVLPYTNVSIDGSDPQARSKSKCE